MKAEYRRELDRIKAATRNGRLYSKDVVAAASDKRNPLHPLFTWDEKEGWRKNLLREAAELIREYTVEVQITKGRTERIRQYVSLSSDRATGGGYRALAEVLGDAQLTAQLLADALSELDMLRAKYGRLKELAKIFAAVDDVQAELERREVTA